MDRGTGPACNLSRTLDRGYGTQIGPEYRKIMRTVQVSHPERGADSGDRCGVRIGFSGVSPKASPAYVLLGAGLFQGLTLGRFKGLTSKANRRPNDRDSEQRKFVVMVLNARSTRSPPSSTSYCVRVGGGVAAPAYSDTIRGTQRQRQRVCES